MDGMWIGEGDLGRGFELALAGSKYLSVDDSVGEMVGFALFTKEIV